MDGTGSGRCWCSGCRGVEHSGGGYPRPEPWVTKRQLAEHLKVTSRWIEMQHHHGLPCIRRGSVVRYRISEVDAWLRRMSRI